MMLETSTGNEEVLENTPPIQLGNRRTELSFAAWRKSI